MAAEHRAGEPPTLRQRSYERLRGLILDGEIMPGEFLSEAELATRLGVSRSPVREALQLLASEGLVEISPRRGTQVAQPSVQEVRESFEYRDAIETRIAALAAVRRSDRQLSALRDALESALAHDEDLSHSSVFHEAIADAAGNRYLRDALDTVAARIVLVSNQASDLVSDPMPQGDSHRALFEAIAAGHPDEAADVMRRHLDYQRDQLIAFLS